VTYLVALWSDSHVAAALIADGVVALDDDCDKMVTSCNGLGRVRVPHRTRD
jgi:hypothetical protein